MSLRIHPRRRKWTKPNNNGASISSCSSTSRTRPAASSRSTTANSATAHSSVAGSTPAPRRLTHPFATQSRRSTSVPASEHTLATLQEDEEQADEDADALGEVVMAIDMSKNGTLGCAYYVAQDEKLFVMEDMQLAGAEMIDMLKLFISPTVVLLSSVADDSVLNALDPNAERSSDGGTGNPFDLPYALELRPRSEFSFEAAKTKLASLKIGEADGPRVSFVIPGDVHAYDDYDENDDGGPTGIQAKLLRFSGWVSMDSNLTVGCSGAILSYLQRRRASRFLPGDHAAQAFFRVSILEMFTMQGTMFVNADTLLSLQIIQSESHPNAHNQGPTKGSSGAKEGLSLYGLFLHLAYTMQGRQMLRQYFLRPSTNIDMINERLHTVTVFTRPDNEIVLSSICKRLRVVKDMKKLTAKLRKGAAGGTSKGGGFARSIWQGLQKFTYHAIGIYHAIGDEVSGADRLAIYAKIRNNFDILHLDAMGRLIESTIDFEQSQGQHRTVVKPHVDPQLDEKKRFYEGISDLLSAVARDLAEVIPVGLPKDLNVIYFPQIGYLIAMPMNPKTGQAYWEGTEEDNWEKMFTSDKMVYYKNDQMNEMDNQFGDIYTEICDREIEIIHDLTQRVLEHEVMLSKVSDILGELDCLCALAQGARKYRLVRPRLTEANIIDIQRGRHLLQELALSACVPNDTYLVGGRGKHVQDEVTTVSDQTSHEMVEPEGPSTIILTGPNYSGKSIYLKQTALIVYLAHIGSFVPATSATIGLTDKILTRISTRESVSRNQSAFMIDVQQMCMALNLATHRSLLIIDEFSKGTNAVDGAALAYGVFEYLLNLGLDAPKTLAATHFHEIFENGLLRPRPPVLALKHMEVRLDRKMEVKDQITYLYNLRDGRSSESFGMVCAAMSGIAMEIVARAEVLGNLVARGEDLVVACSGLGEEEATELVDAEQIARRLLIKDIDGDVGLLLDEVLAPTEDLSME